MMLTMPYNFTAIEKKWQAYWLTNKSFAALDPAAAGNMPKSYILDMFPYPSGAGLHVGHPEGYIATDIISRYRRMCGHNVMHPIGWDAFGLPAEQYAIKTNTHPRQTTQKNIAKFRQQLQMLGLGYDWDREIDTTDPRYYKWTQWIFLQLFNSYFDPVEKKAKPITHLMQELVAENLLVAPDLSLRLNPGQEGLDQVAGEVMVERRWRDLTPDEQRDVIDAQRLAYTDDLPVNWCPGLGTVLANEEVIDGKSEVGGFPVERRPMRQWMLRITAYADRLLADLDTLAWSDSLKDMQRNWIGRSIGADVDFDLVLADVRPAAGGADENDQDDDAITVFTTRPDTLYGATYMVLAPEHPLVDRITTGPQQRQVAAYRAMVAGKSERDRMAQTREKTGVFTGALARNPVNGQKIPIYIADYVLMGYGTGAIMAVPAHDERDFEFARKFSLPLIAVVMPDDQWIAMHKPADAEFASMDRSELAAAYQSQPQRWATAFVGDGIAINSPRIDCLPTPAAKENIAIWLNEEGLGRRSVKYKLRDWLFARQRYWGEPFPIILDEQGNAMAVAKEDLPVVLPEMSDFKPTGTPEGPLSKATRWLELNTPQGHFVRETNTMPQWAGSCWYYLRYLDPRNPDCFVDPEKEKYWMPVDLYVGGTEHAVLHLLYARFWHKMLFDLGHVGTPEPFARLVNQGMILGETELTLFEDAAGRPVSLSDLRDLAEEMIDQEVKLAAIHRQTGAKVIGRRIPEGDCERRDDGYRLKSDSSIRVDARSFKMSKSRGNVVTPDDIVRDYGADTLRLFEMYMGPLEASKPWSTRDIVGMSRFLNSLWRNLIGDDESSQHPDPQSASPDPLSPARVDDTPACELLDRQVHRTIKKVGQDIEGLRFNTAIAELIKLNNELSGMKSVPRFVAESLVLLLAPFAPHTAEEIWQRLGHGGSIGRHPWPQFDPAKLVEATMELPVQVNGRLRDRISVPADFDELRIIEVAMAAEKVKPHLAGKILVKKLYVPHKLVNLVIK